MLATVKVFGQEVCTEQYDNRFVAEQHVIQQLYNRRSPNVTGEVIDGDTVTTFKFSHNRVDRV